ncbi:LOW QUALITY PROTEIN: homeobox-DDT domain protein RLT2 [Neltuma alba]|uniref:LOW QUALITY PROTEIN: homeobox-DDT domain protein RLT2 n=1 Tax=Neltuma alba TaxID=207710 RepID=UPI0010A2AC02|nr:LOW QUALITY PROTEIN: homeobox-DDT domain protein RLT2 [Prosopis alba]
MEACSEGEQKKPPEGENKSKRKMKTASQLEILEKTYATEPYPSEALRAELSAKLCLSDRQLQMWFCHRRLKDRKAPAAKKPGNESPPGAVTPAPVADGFEQKATGDGGHGRDSISGKRRYSHMDPRRAIPRPCMAFPSIGGGLPAMESYYGSHQFKAELKAIAFVEEQLGEPLREDGPILGMEFDPLPPGAFGTPIGPTAVGQHRQSGRPFEAKIYERVDKGASRTLHEYKFIPEQPTVRNETYDYERVTPSNHYGSLDGIPHARTLLSSGRQFLDGNDIASYGYGYQNMLPGLNLLSQQGRQNHLLPSASGQNDNIPWKNTFADVPANSHIGAYPATKIDSMLTPSDQRVIHEEQISRFQRKRKNEEARMQRELEAQEKRMKKELEKQDILRRKREEQVRKEMERHERERRKEEERILRERQREVERNQREQKRELVRREKILQKESIRAEKRKQKEEVRKEKEAARIKAANERAIARRMVKESMESIEDERLELMELAASEKGLSSILSLDYETLQNLELFKDGRTSFPPQSVLLKRPFSIQPWLDSEENVGNLLMVWRFLISFADVLGIWPFTLDEFLQALHDHDPRLLGEIHIALLRSIIKDIEDVARTTGAGASHNNAVNPCGGHPQVVEGAYVWGFDIRNWQRLLNPLTWPEIMRQFALSAGFGPQLKKRILEPVYPCDNNQVIDGEDVISNLRSGAAVENAVAIMQEKGLSNQRRSRHRLTPGTVKFAAFHVLSLEGSKGLTILETADKIQKSGLRDLTTSKTPEASIAAALSRDTKLFERTAPSTYCVRPAYRKDPADGEALLSAARERIRIFKNGLVNAEEPDDGERDDDSEIGMAEEPEADDLGTETNNKEASDFVESSLNTVVKNRESSGEILQTPDRGNGQMNEGSASIVAEEFNREIAASSNVVTKPDLEDTSIDESNPGEPWVEGLIDGEYSNLSVEERLNALVALIGVAIQGNSIRFTLEERLEAANALKKQMWTEVQLDRHRIKEESFFKVQSAPCVGNKNEPTPSVSAIEGKQSPLLDVDDRNDKTLPAPPTQQLQLNDVLENQTYLQSVPSEVNIKLQDSAVTDNYSCQQFGSGAEKSKSNFKAYIGQLAEETYIYRSLPLGLDRRRNRYWQFITCASQNDPGCGRVFVEMHDGCWMLIDSEEGFDALLASLDVRGIRESHLHMMLQRIEMSFKESVRRNKLTRQDSDTVNTEAFQMATKHGGCASMCSTNSDVPETSTSFVVQLGRNDSDNQEAFRRYQDFEKWMLKEGLDSSVLCALRAGKRRCRQLLGMCNHCHEIYLSEETPSPSCCRTLRSCKSNLSSSEHMAQCEGKVKITSDYVFSVSPSPLRIRLLKVLLSILEASIPEEALEPIWTDSYRKSWIMKLHAASSSEELLEILTLLEGAIKRDYLASNFNTTSELLGSIFSSGFLSDSTGADRIPVLPWVPHTTAAVALRFMELDSSIFYTLEQKLESEKDKRNENVMKFPSKHSSAKIALVAGIADTSHLAGHNMVNLGAGFASYSRGQRSHGQSRGRSYGGGSQGRVISSRSESRKKVTATSSRRRLGQGLRWKGKSRGHGGQRRARRSVRSGRKKPAAKGREITVERDAPKEESAGIFVREASNGAETIGRQMGNPEIAASSSGRSDYEEDKYQVTGDEDDYLVDNNDNGYDRCGFSGKSENMVEGISFNLDDEEDGGGFSGKSDNLVEAIDFNIDDEEEEDVDEDEDDEQVGVDVEGFINGDSDIEENGEDAEQNLDPDGLNSSSSEYSG